MWIAETCVLVLLEFLHENFPVEIIFYNLGSAQGRTRSNKILFNKYNISLEQAPTLAR